jgi:hypothetical protein
VIEHRFQSALVTTLEYDSSQKRSTIGIRMFAKSLYCHSTSFDTSVGSVLAATHPTSSGESIHYQERSAGDRP